MVFFGDVKKQTVALFLGCLLNMNGLVSQEPPTHKKVIVGSGIIGALEAYNVYLDSLKSGTPVQVTIYEKSPTFREGAPTNTAYHICPST